MAGRSPNGDAGDTAERILDVAERLVQTRGFNGFSYADIAGELGMTKAALHYHFAGKAELGEALVTRYAERFAAAHGIVLHELMPVQVSPVTVNAAAPVSVSVSTPVAVPPELASVNVCETACPVPTCP